MTLIVGIDPGSRTTGYGLIRVVGNQLTFIDAGTIYTQSKEMPERIKTIFEGVSRIVAHHQHNWQDETMVGAIEQVFMAENADSALKLGQARGAAIAALTVQGLSVAEYTARQIKQAVCGYGAADKAQVMAMVMKILALDFTPQVDASDALACAICHAHSGQSINKILAQTASATRTSSKKKGRWRLSEAELLARLNS